MLTQRQSQFVDHFTITRSAAEAARRAGFSHKCARQIGSRLLTKVDVQAEIERKTRRVAARLEIEFEDVLRGLLEAHAEAKVQRNPAAMISALREIGRLLDFYPRKSGKAEPARPRRLEELSDGELLALIDGECTPPSLIDSSDAA